MKKVKENWIGEQHGQVWPKPSYQAQWRGKKTRPTEEEVGRQHQGMDRPGGQQALEGSGEQRKMEEAGCRIICGAPTWSFFS